MLKIVSTKSGEAQFRVREKPDNSMEIAEKIKINHGK
jgi:hypothetical protein